MVGLTVPGGGVLVAGGGSVARSAGGVAGRAGCGRVVVGGAGCRGAAWAPAMAGTSVRLSAASSPGGMPPFASSRSPAAVGNETSVGALTVAFVTSVPLSKRSWARRLATLLRSDGREIGLGCCCSVWMVLMSVDSPRGSARARP